MLVMQFFLIFPFSAKCGYVWLSAHIYGSKLSNVRHFSSRMYSYMIAGKSCLNGSLLIHPSYKRLVAQVGLILRKFQVPFMQIGGSYFQYGVPWWWPSRCFGEQPLVNMLGAHPHPPSQEFKRLTHETMFEVKQHEWWFERSQTTPEYARYDFIPSLSASRCNYELRVLITHASMKVLLGKKKKY